jgi:hypothetical protein
MEHLWVAKRADKTAEYLAAKSVDETAVCWVAAMAAPLVA